MRTENVAAPHAFEDCPEERAFRFASGERALNLAAFREVLARAPTHVVDYHRTHFAPWIADVVGDPPLAERFRYYGASGMDGDELRRLLVQLADLRLAELKTRQPAEEKPARRARVVG